MLSTTDHVYVVPVGTILPPTTDGWLAGVTVKAVALHVVAVCAVTNGFGLTVTVTVNVDPGHDPDNGVTV